MTAPCYPLEELVSIVEQPRGEPRREHLENCPRCLAALLAYRDFMDVGDLPGEALPERARARLGEFLRVEVLGERPRRSPVPGGPRSHQSWNLRRWMAQLAAPALRPAWALAGLVIVVLILVVPRGMQAPVESVPTLRGQIGSGQGQLAAEARVLASGEMQFTWTAVEGTDRYEIRFYGTDLTEVARRGAGRDVSLQITKMGLAQTTSGVPARLWRVVGLRGEEEVVRSPLQELPASW